jgi:hypothetical protein
MGCLHLAEALKSIFTFLCINHLVMVTTEKD